MCIKEIFKRFRVVRVYTTILTSLLTIGLFAYGEIVVLNQNATSEVSSSSTNINDQDSPRKDYVLNLQQITCTTTAGFDLYNKVTIKVYTDNQNLNNYSNELAFWGPKQLASGNTEPVNINVVFRNQITVIVTYLDYNNTEQTLAYIVLNRLNSTSSNSVSFSSNGANYSLSYSIQAIGSSGE